MARHSTVWVNLRCSWIEGLSAPDDCAPVLEELEPDRHKPIVLAKLDNEHENLPGRLPDGRQGLASVWVDRHTQTPGTAATLTFSITSVRDSGPNAGASRRSVRWNRSTLSIARRVRSLTPTAKNPPPRSLPTRMMCRKVTTGARSRAAGRNPHDRRRRKLTLTFL